jgi:TldD protein
MKELLSQLIRTDSGFIELRYHKRISRSFVAQKGRLDVATQSITAGIGVRAFEQGVWGFAATTRMDAPGIRSAIDDAKKHARMIALERKTKPMTLDASRLAKLDFKGPGVDELQTTSTDQKLKSLLDWESALSKQSKFVQSSACKYSEIIEEKHIFTSDGAAASMILAQPEFSISAIAEKEGQRATSYKSAGVSGGWQCLFTHPALNNMVDTVAKTAVDLTSAKYPDPGKKTVILAPSVVGLLCHEAIGHTVEADFVKAGSVAQGLIGQKVASPLVSMADSGQETFSGYATGNLPFDDEGVLTETTMIITDGNLTSYLHNRETAKEFGRNPTGNARAWLYSDEPLIRMRNTYLLPGTSNLADMIASTEDGYLVEGAGGGQADANGEFMFGASHLRRIKNGKVTDLLCEATLSGQAFDVLKSVDQVSKEFQWDLGSGYCGKGQPAKVDAGGPYVRCQINVGGQIQE